MKFIVTNGELRTATAIALALVFFCLCLFTLLHHEMWRDELHSWLIARDSSSLPELLFNKRHEGHPALWYLCLFTLSRFFHQPPAMQLFHLLVATGSVYIFLRFSPFTRLEKILFIFGYYPLFEYGVLSRNYALGILFLFAFCALFRQRDKNHLLLSLLLFLLMQTSLYGLLIALLLAVVFVGKRISPRERPGDLMRRRIPVDIIILIFGVILSLKCMIPAPDYGIYTGGHDSFEIKRVLRVLTLIWKSYVPLPRLVYHFWNTNILDRHLLLQVGLTALFFFYFLFIFLKKLPVLFIYFAGTGAIMAFHYLKFFGYLRHHGHLFLILIISLWLSRFFAERAVPGRILNALISGGRRSLPVVLPLILSANLLAGIGACCMDWIHPFTASKEVAEYIKENHLQEMIIAGDVDDAILAFPVHLRKEIYYPRSDRFGTFVIYDRNVRWRQMRIPEILGRIEELMKEKKQDILIILNYRLPESVLEVWEKAHRIKGDDAEKYSGRIVKLPQFHKSIVADERYFLYIMKSEVYNTENSGPIIEPSL